MDDSDYMQMALDKALEGVNDGQTPFGACIVLNKDVIACEHNTVFGETDITAHAEVNAIRSACMYLNSIDLSGAVIYSTCEPCPMCFSAIHWAKIDMVVYGAEIRDAKAHGFSELTIPTSQMKKLGKSKVDIVGDFMRDEAIGLFNEWAGQTDKKTY